MPWRGLGCLVTRAQGPSAPLQGPECCLWPFHLLSVAWPPVPRWVPPLVPASQSQPARPPSQLSLLTGGHESRVTHPKTSVSQRYFHLNIGSSHPMQCLLGGTWEREIVCAGGRAEDFGFSLPSLPGSPCLPEKSRYLTVVPYM